MAVVGERVAALCDLYMLQKVSLHDEAAHPAALNTKARKGPDCNMAWDSAGKIPPGA